MGRRRNEFPSVEIKDKGPNNEKKHHPLKHTNRRRRIEDEKKGQVQRGKKTNKITNAYPSKFKSNAITRPENGPIEQMGPISPFL